LAKKNKRSKGGNDPAFRNRPFAGLKLDLESSSESKPVPSAPEPKREVEPDRHTDEDYYAEIMSGVTRIDGGTPLAEKQHRAKPMLAEESEERLVMRQLDSLVHGDTPFDFADTDEYIEACVNGFDRRRLRKLKRGEYSYQAHLDLHGYNRDEARDLVGKFIRKSVGENKSCVLIIHGRGLGSKDNIPVLKHKLAAWLTRGYIGRHVLAFTSAKHYDGGTGAVYVLLHG
jgi:DNA-nicking Smr family endonuclease